MKWLKRKLSQKKARPFVITEENFAETIDWFFYAFDQGLDYQRDIVANRMADYLSYNLTAIQPIILKQIKRKLQAFDARTSAWKEAE